VLTESEWRERQAAHHARVDALTAGHRARRATGAGHPGEDFLFTYYPFKPAALRRWHPGVGVDLEDAATTERRSWRFARITGDRVGLDVAAYLDARFSTVTFVRALLAATADRTPHFGCFALHEWAMVYRLDQDTVRHRGLPLRLGPEGSDAVVEAQTLTCTHFDAFRFFTDPARPRNAVQPTRDDQVRLDQPGCVHAGMDLYKWAMKLAPAVPSELTADCFEHARDLRVLDMRASPYDVTELGYEPIEVETPSGRALFAQLQRSYAVRSADLRARLLAVCASLIGGQRQ
jgi:hypothetical protein